MVEASSPVRALQEMLHTCVADWLYSEMCGVLSDQHLLNDVNVAMVRGSAQSVAEALLRDLDDLLSTDPDEQRSNPLAMIRGALAEPSAVLLRIGARPTTRDDFAVNANPHDVFDLAPASWTDIDVRLHEPGLEWGAWKAATVLMRRRNEGLR